MNRIAIVLNAQGEIERVVSDEPIRCFTVDDNCPRDRVYELTTSLYVGVQHMRDVLGNEPTGHALDALGEGYGPRKAPAKPALKVVE